LDPIDGTKGFLRGDQYAVALALIKDAEVQIGVLGCPNLQEGGRSDKEGPGLLFVAVRGQGAWGGPLTDAGPFTRLSVSRREDPVEARVLRSFESGHTHVSRTEEWMDAMGVRAEAVRMDSQAKYAMLAAGRGDLLVRFLSPKQPDYKEKIWDHAAGLLVVEEAGGRVSDLHGKPLDFNTGRMLTNNRGLLASNGLLHDAALKAMG
jgi:3'(2'), 5'-bisphosphate nucleotidase